MTEYIIGNWNDKAEIIDFLNYVFSQLRVPHDFKRLMPVLYADDVLDFETPHYLVKRDGKILACVMNHTIDVSVNGHLLKFGMIGNVAVHPYARGEGFMRKLMQTAVEEAKHMGVDILVLGGKRQRYGYFGFENAGANFRFTVTEDNIRHCLYGLDCSEITFRPVEEASGEEIDHAISLYERKLLHSLRKREEFVKLMHTWNLNCSMIYKSGRMIGYTYADFTELVVEDEKYFPLVLKKLFDDKRFSEIAISVAPFEKERVAILSEICECSEIKTVEMVNVLCWGRVLNAFLELKAKVSPLRDGEVDVMIEDEGYRICVVDGVPSVEKTADVRKDAVRLSHNRAEQLFFGLDSLLLQDERFKNWIPLPFTIDTPDVC